MSSPKPTIKSANVNPAFREGGRVVEELKTLYYSRLLAIEREYSFAKLCGFPEILEAELEAKPLVLLLGQYSTGKTSFVKHLIGCDYPEIHIGPEPTTDKFVAVVHGDEEKTIKGNALTGVSDLPFGGLSVFGSGFLNKCGAAVVPAPLLKDLNIIDTPGVLSGEKQRTSRGYDFAKVSRFFAARSDLILLMFDPSKLDISDEFRAVIEELQPYEDKVHCVLNKADSLDTESLMRVYGALLWGIGKVFKGAEVSRVYVGSFKDTILREEHTKLFEKDKEVLLGRLHDLARTCGMRKVNDMVKRLRLMIVHVCVLGYLRSKMPVLWGQEAAQKRLINDLPKVFAEVAVQYGLADGDFPKLEEFRTALRMADFTKFPLVNRDILNNLQDILSTDIPRIIAHCAGVVKEGPGAAIQLEAEEAAAALADAKKRSKQPSIFTISAEENRTGAQYMYLGLFLGLILTIFVALVAVAVSLNPSLQAKLQDLTASFVDIFSGLFNGSHSTVVNPPSVPPLPDLPPLKGIPIVGEH